jgi:Tol biopolymer transport system component
VRTCLRRCLQKPPRQRLQAIGDARLALEGAFDELPVGPVAAPPRPRERTTWLAAVLVGTALVAALGTRWFYVHQFQQQPTPITFSIPSPEDSSFNTLAGHAVSPDGRYVAFVASGQLWVHSFGSAASRQLAGTQGAASPFWSPDGRWIGFFGGGSLKKIQVAGGTPLDLCDVGFQRGGTWNSDDVIVFGSSVGPLQQIPAGGGTPTPVSAMAENETGHWWPWFLPDGEHFLYLAATGDRRDLRVGSLTSADSAPLGNFESHVAYGAGHLFFLQGRNLMAQPFDTDRLQTTAEPLLVADGQVAMNVWQQGGFSASAAGVLSYLKGGNARYQLMWVDRSGKLLERVGEPRVMATLSLSPDKQRVAVSSPTAGTYDIWVLDLARGGAGTPVTFGPNHEFDPAWSSDGLRLLFNSNRTGLFSLYRRASDGTGDEELLKGSQTDLTLPDWSADGRSIVYTERGLATTGLDLWTLPLSSDGPPGRPTIFLQTPFNEGAGVFSPNGDWIAYESDESGRYEVHMRRFPSAEDRKPISREGGRSPQWRRDGRELYYLAPDQTLMAVAVDEATGDVGVPQPLPVKAVGASSSYAASGDGRRFLVKTVDAPASWEFTVVVNWPATADH